MNSFLLDFDKQCSSRPAAIALIHEERKITYAQLDRLSRQMTVQLTARDLVVSDSVALMCERSVGAIRPCWVRSEQVASSCR